MQVYLAIQGQKAGPFSLFQVEEKLRAGEVGNATLGWYEGMERWQPLGDLPPFESFFRRHREEKAAREWEGEEAPADAVAASQEIAVKPWTRFWARSLDQTFFWYGALALALLFQHWQWVSFTPEQLNRVLLLSFPAMFILEMLCLAKWGATPGKFLLGIRVIDANGDPPTLGQAIRRTLGVIVFGFGCFLWLPLMAFAHIMGYHVLKRRGIAMWDASADLQVMHEPFQPRHVIFPVILVLSLSVLLAGPMKEMNQELLLELEKQWGGWFGK